MKRIIIVAAVLIMMLVICSCSISIGTPAPTPTPIIIYMTPSPAPETPAPSATPAPATPAPTAVPSPTPTVPLAMTPPPQGFVQNQAKVTVTPGPTARPTPTPAPLTPPVIRKDPTTESVVEGGNAYFVAKADNYNYITWSITSPDHSRVYSASEAIWYFPGLSVGGESTTQLILANCPLSLNGWCVEATFHGVGGNSTTNHCYVYVTKAQKTPIWASPSGGYFEDYDAPVQLNAAPGDQIYYELYTYSVTRTGTINSGDYIYVPCFEGIKYDAYLYAYVVGDPSNATTGYFTMNGVYTPTEMDLYNAINDYIGTLYDYGDYGGIIYGDEFDDADVYYFGDDGIYYYGENSGGIIYY